jgi:tetratricopeptide (TPR) repeat protein
MVPKQKLRAFLILIVLTLSGNMMIKAQGDPDYQQVKAANKLYAEEKYKEAAETYENILLKGLSASELHYNLGNAYYRLGDYKRAILNYERALLLNPDDQNAQINLEFAQRFIQDKIEIVPKFFLVKWSQGFVNMFSERGWAVVSISSFILFLLFLIFFLFSRIIALRKLSVYFGFFSFLITGLSFYFASVQHQKITGHSTAIVFSPSVTVKSSPNESGTELFIIHEGLKVTITDEMEGWKEIKLSDGKIGWLPANTIEEI